MATYNGARYLKEQLDSFVAQTQLPDELIICDDASSDETVKILSAFAKQAPFNVHLQCNLENLGYAKNFSKALSLCTGDLVFLSDQDDVWFPDKIKTIVNLAEDDAVNQVFMNDAELTYGDLRPTGLTKLGQIRTAGLSERAFVMGCCAAIKSRLLKDALPIPGGYGAHDAWIIDMAYGLEKRRVIEKSLQYYRRHEDNVSSFVANRTRKINRASYLWHQIVSRFNNDSIDTLIHSLEKIDHLIDRLKQMRSGKDSDYVTTDKINERLSELVCTRAASTMRMEVLQKPRVRRIYPIAKMLIRGQYKYFLGTKSALGDFLFN